MRIHFKLISIAFHLHFILTNLYSALGATTFHGKLKAYQNGLDLILHCRPIIDILGDRNSSQKLKVESPDAVHSTAGKENADEEKGSDEHKLMEDEENLVALLEQRLQFILRSLTKLFVTKSSSGNKKEYVL